MKLLAKNYKTRMDLENEVRNKIGLTTDVKAGKHSIEGEKHELAALGLSDRSIFWGVPCVITDEPTEIRKQDKAPDRGKRTKFGINGRNVEPPVVGKIKNKKSKRQ